MASVLLVLLVATLAVSADASRYGQLQKQQPSYPSSSSSCNQQNEDLGFDDAVTLSCAVAQEGALLLVWNKCCNELGKCGMLICPAVKEVADSIPFLQGLCGNYACSAGMWNNKTGEDATSTLEYCKLASPDDKAEGCKAVVEDFKEKHMDCFCKRPHLKRN